MLEVVHGASELSQRKQVEGPCFQGDIRWNSERDRAEAQDVHVPGDRVDERYAAKKRGQRLDRVKHRARKEEDKIENRRQRVEDVVAADPKREDRVKVKPSSRPQHDREQKQRESLPAN